jgi:leader peptidase (prepilin peptidase) / N-methyltransferase
MGGLFIWVFRIAARWAMGQEALGFGDVTLMAMIGSFFGWQIVWIAFFMSPFFAMIFVVITWIATRDSSLPFGPYLCAATLFCMLNWVSVWESLGLLFLPPQFALPILACFMVVFAGLLWMVQRLKQQLSSLTSK